MAAIFDDSDEVFMNRVGDLLKAGTALPDAGDILPLTTHIEATARRRAVFLLSQIGGDEAISAVCERLADEVEVVRSAAVSSLGRLQARSATAPLLALFRERPEDQSLLKAAAEALAKIADPESLAPLQEASKTFPGFTVRSACMMAVSRIQSTLRAGQRGA